MNKIFILFVFYTLLSITSALNTRESIQELSQTQNFVQKSYYVITAPKVWMSAEESVCLVMLKDLSLPNAVINVKISSMNTREVFAQRYQPLNSFSQCIRISTSDIRADKALLTVQLADVIDETLEIRVKPSNGLTLIETSKPIYRPSERLEFRIITVNDWLRPIDEQIKVISVENSHSMPVMQWTDMNCTNGMIALDMPIADDNYSGIWKIKVMTNNNIITEKIFKVYDYEMPNTLITIDSPNYIDSSAEQVLNKVCVRNSFGQLLKGKMKLFVSYIKFDWERVHMLKHLSTPYELTDFEINGCYDFTLKSSQLNWNSSKYSQRNLKLSFQFTDDTNGFIDEKFMEIPVVDQQLIINFPSVKLMKQYFKPTLPYFGHILVSLPDYTPAANHRLNVCYQSRDMPWLSSDDYMCTEHTSNGEGMVEFTIPPMSVQTKQIELKVFSIKYPSIESRMILEPTYSPSGEYMTVRPLIDRNNCNDFIAFDVLYNKPMAKQSKQIYYQVIGRGLIHEPQVYIVEHLNRWSTEDMIFKTNQSYDVFISKMNVKLPVQSALNNNLINRILIYYLDSNNNLIADSTVFLSTCSDHNQHSTRIELGMASNDNGIKLRLNTRPNTTCAVRLSKHKPYNSLKRINQFIERFNIRQDFTVRDKCERAYNLRRFETVATYSPYMAPYGFDSMGTSYDPVINYGDAWDSFNDIGLLVTSNARLDDSPCDWDLYPRDILSQLSELRGNQKQFLSKNRMKKIARNQIQDIERSLLNEVFDWNLVNTDNNNTIIDHNISHELVSNSGQLYGDTVCLNKHFGITYARDVFDRHIMNDKQLFLMSVMAPKHSRIGDTLVLNVLIERTLSQQRMQNCLPIEIVLKSTESYESIDDSKVLCICGTNTSKPIPMLVRPKTMGSLAVKLVAKYPTDVLSADMIAQTDCVKTNTIIFEPQTVVRQLSVSPMGMVSTQVNHQIVCNTNNKNISEPQIQGLSQYMTDGTDMIVSTELVQPMLRHINAMLAHNNHNCMDSLSAFANAFYLYSYLHSNDVNTYGSHKNQLTHELSKAFQTLMTYRHTDGSYSVLKSRRHESDVALTASVLRVLAQSKPHLAFIENGNRINRLKDTLIWIFQQQSEDGCFRHKHKASHTNIWPISLVDTYELTGYVLATLLETGLDYNTKPLAKAYNCLTQNSNQFLKTIDSKPLSAIIYTYIQILSGNTIESDVWIKSLDKVLNNLKSNDLLNVEMLSYVGLSRYLSNDISGAKSIGQMLINKRKLWQTPISCYAIIKLWPLIRHKTSTYVKVYENDNQLVSTLEFNETHSHHRLPDAQKISVQNDGCLLVTNNRQTTDLETKLTNFDININGLNRGIMACNRRRINICIKKKTDVYVKQLVLRIQLITGFDVEKQLMKKMIDSEMVTKYKKIGSELWLFLHQCADGHNSGQSYCFIVPVLQKHEFLAQNKAFVKIYDYYNEDISDVMTYHMPLKCEIDGQ